MQLPLLVDLQAPVSKDGVVPAQAPLSDDAATELLLVEPFSIGLETPEVPVPAVDVPEGLSQAPLLVQKTEKFVLNWITQSQVQSGFERLVEAKASAPVDVAQTNDVDFGPHDETPMPMPMPMPTSEAEQVNSGPTVSGQTNTPENDVSGILRMDVTVEKPTSPIPVPQPIGATVAGTMELRSEASGSDDPIAPRMPDVQRVGESVVLDKPRLRADQQIQHTPKQERVIAADTTASAPISRTPPSRIAEDPVQPNTVPTGRADVMPTEQTKIAGAHSQTQTAPLMEAKRTSVKIADPVLIDVEGDLPAAEDIPVLSRKIETSEGLPVPRSDVKLPQSKVESMPPRVSAIPDAQVGETLNVAFDTAVEQHFVSEGASLGEVRRLDSHVPVGLQMRPEMQRAVISQLAQVPLKPDQPVELRLDPQELGQVRMVLSSHEQTLTLVMSAERPETLDLMRRHIDQLAQEFREMGYTDLNFSFAEQETDSGQNNDTGHALEQASETKEPETQPQVLSLGPVSGLDIRL